MYVYTYTAYKFSTIHQRYFTIADKSELAVSVSSIFIAVLASYHQFLTRQQNFANQNASVLPLFNGPGEGCTETTRRCRGLGRKKEGTKEVIGVRHSSTPVSETVSPGKT